MAEIPVPGYQTFWTTARESIKSEFQRLVGQHPDAEEQLKQLYKILCDIEDVAAYTPASVGESEQWSSIVNTVEENRANFCKALSWKTLYSALYGTYTATLNELKGLLKTSTAAKSGTTGSPRQHDGFQEVRRRKRHNMQEAAKTSKKAAVQSTPQPESNSPKEIATRNFYAPLRTTEMDTDAANAEASPRETTTAIIGRPPPIILTSATNLLQFQKSIKDIVKGSFELRSTKNGTRVLTKEMADFSAIKSFFL
jgi:hypothetical protein